MRLFTISEFDFNTEDIFDKFSIQCAWLLLGLKVKGYLALKTNEMYNNQQAKLAKLMLTSADENAQHGLYTDSKSIDFFKEHLND